MQRLSAGTAEPDMKITVLNDNSFGICVSLPDHTAAEGVTVTVADLDAGGAAKTLLTDTSGHAIFAVKDFSPDSDGYMNVSIRVEKAGYRDVFVAKTSVKKGGVFSAITLIADDGSPYVSSITFNGKDAFAQELGVYYSPANDASQDLSVQVCAQGTFTVELTYVSTDGKAASGGSYSGVAGKNQVFSFKGDWLRKFKPGAKVSVRLTAGDGTSQTFDTQLMVQRGVLDGPLFDQSGAMSSILSLGGLGFTLPSSLPSFLAGSSIGFDLPSKYIPQIGINLDGSAYFAMGISMKDVTGADDAALWKTQDQADLEKRQREVEKEGYFAKQFAKAQAV